ncbi:MAG: preprotein translocase subunit SecY [archaeon GW2011_AR17]|nr:MAG: preprotein translocase subunit SecY [archaeon GW2011_AR17]MBS3154291.1 preprotein translocase subunit SecY [Candidatus Woesearchaeota archaeon]HII13811.1 preprotein translocase subunit SecY [Nanoarchaeota archaeon]HIJ05057.1 preprotein translocase subunit SecY [Nanoarchaeota archaeon]
MSFLNTVLMNLPEVQSPLQKKLGFKEKLQWTMITLVAFFLLGLIPLYGLGENSLAQFEFLSIILGASFGSIISLGIGPLVTSSIVLQLLNGSGLVKFDLSSVEGKKRFQGVQKLLSIFFIIFEAGIYVFMGGLAPSALLDPSQFRTMEFILIGQLIVGGILIMFMDEIISKWGFGSGISLFIAAGVASEIMIRAFSPLTTAGTFAFGTSQDAVGKVWVFISSLANQNPTGAILALSSILATILIFFVVVYVQAMKVEIPLSFGRIRGHGIRWPLNFLYTSNIPVILIAALLANVQLWARLLEKWGHPLLGTYSGSSPVSGFVLWITPQNLVQAIITGSLTFSHLAQALVYLLFMVGGAIIFGIFWVQTSGMDASAQARNMLNSGLQIPGFRRDQRVLEAILDRYIFPLTVMGGAAVGILAASADLMGALTQGTGILLAVMIIYKLYEEIANQHMMDMHPALAKIMTKS